MTLEDKTESINFYETHLPPQTVETCKFRAISRTTVQQAVDNEISYSEMLERNYTELLVEAYRNNLEREE